MQEQLKKPIWPWIATGVLIPVLYVASIGPMVWLRATVRPTASLSTLLFRSYLHPFEFTALYCAPDPVQKRTTSYLRWWDPNIPSWERSRRPYR